MEDDGPLNLRWDDHDLTFVHLLDHFRLQELYCDASLACGGGGVYQVHKVVLSACSDFFASIFASSTCQNPVVVLQDVACEHLEALLTYLYRGQVLIARHALPSFLKVAESLQVKGLARPSLLTLPRDTYSASSTVSPPCDALHAPTHTPTHSTHSHPPSVYTHRDPPPYPRQEMVTPPHARCGASWEEEEGCVRSGAPPQASPKAKGSTQGHGDRQRPPRKRFSPHFVEPFGGTFQNLVTSEEEMIKEEPEDDIDICDTEQLTIYEEEVDMEEGEEEEEYIKEEHMKEQDKEEKQEEDDKTREERKERREGTDEKKEEVKIMMDTRDYLLPLHTKTTTTPSPTPTHSPTTSPTHSPTPGHTPTQPNSLSPTSATPATLATSNPTQAKTTSQLRQELLKPLQYRVAHLGIPHPVIASREAEELLARTGLEIVPGDFPPLIKISTSPVSVPTSSLHLPPQYHHHHHLHPRQSYEGDITTTTTSPAYTTTTTTSITPVSPTLKSPHLLVTTQPTYRTRLPHQTTPTTTIPPPQYPTTFLHTPFKPTPHIDTDTPLNLSQNTTHHHRSHTTTANTEQHRPPLRDRDPFLGKILTNRKRRLRGPKSWEYLVRLLRDPSTNPSLIRWENETKAVFRLVQPAAIAQRWGRRTGKHASECLSYENFARGLRYHYATGALQPVSERSFVYKFGPKAIKALGDEDYEVPYSVAAMTGEGGHF